MNPASCQSRHHVQQVLEQAFNPVKVRLLFYLLIITTTKRTSLFLLSRDCSKLMICLPR